jgi:hypothetical protein
VCIQYPGRPFNNQSVQLLRPDGFSERLAEAVQEIEDERLLNLDLFLRALE